jgi:hypothetical protein
MKLLAPNEGSWSPVMAEPFEPGEGIELPWTVDDRAANLFQATTGNWHE